MSRTSPSGADRATVDSSCPKNNRLPLTPVPLGELGRDPRPAPPLPACILFVGHGSRRTGANQEFEQLVRCYRDRCPELHVCHGYIELAQPSLADAIDHAAQELPAGSCLTIVPVFLFRAGHCKNDLPMATSKARARHPHLRFTVAEPLGVDMRLVELAWRRVAAASETCLRTTVLLVGRGSSDPGANAELCRIARLIFEGRGLRGVEVAFIGITQPDVQSALERLARQRPTRIVVLPYLLFAGRLIERLRGWVEHFGQQYPWIKVVLANHLGDDPSVFDVLESRAAEARTGERLLDCDACAYRAPMPGRFHEAGGLRALLWSLRHEFTHAQAMPAEHAHVPLQKHVLVCGNVDCVKRGSLGLLADLRRRIKGAGRTKEVRVTRTSCMGRCGEGPTVAVYPDGIWYREVQSEDVQELVSEHLFGDRLVGRLVDNIMQ